MRKMKKYSSALILILVIFLFIIFLAFPEQSSASAKKSIFICLETLIPSLFPFFVLSSLAVSLGFSKLIGNVFSRFMRPLFKCSPKTASPFVLGLLSGFPVGASTSVKLYKNGEISRGDCSKSLAFSNNPSVGFVVSVAGAGILKDVRVGWILYISLTLASVFSGMITCRLFPEDKFMLEKSGVKEVEISVLQKFLFAVRDGGAGVLNVSAFVVFFSVVCGVVGDVLHIPYPFSSLLFGFFEISSGISSINPYLLSFTQNAVIAAAVLAWSGLSVHSQVLFSVADTDVSPFPYLFSKMLTTVLSVLFTFVLILF